MKSSTLDREHVIVTDGDDTLNLTIGTSRIPMPRIAIPLPPRLSAANEATSTIWHPAQLHPSYELLFSTHGPPDPE
ncbi:MAG: hypothetical protein ACR2N1_00655 [Rubripirellula sp.]